MKKLNKVIAITSMFLVGAFVNAQANSFSFTGYANSFQWYQVSEKKTKDSDTPRFSAKADLIGSADTLLFSLEFTDGTDICEVSAIEGARDWSTCGYPTNANSAKGTQVVPYVKSDTFSMVNFPISGQLDVY